MARFDVYANPSKPAGNVPYLLDVQSNLLQGLNSCLVIPLRRLDAFEGLRLPERLCPIVQVQGASFMLDTPQLAAIPRKALKNAVYSLADEQSRITAALDFVFQGY
jgi:toxin CcdB